MSPHDRWEMTQAQRALEQIVNDGTQRWTLMNALSGEPHTHFDSTLPCWATHEAPLSPAPTLSPRAYSGADSWIA